MDSWSPDGLPEAGADDEDDEKPGLEFSQEFTHPVGNTNACSFTEARWDDRCAGAESADAGAWHDGQGPCTHSDVPAAFGDIRVIVIAPVSIKTEPAETADDIGVSHNSAVTQGVKQESDETAQGDGLAPTQWVQRPDPGTNSSRSHSPSPDASQYEGDVLTIPASSGHVQVTDMKKPFQCTVCRKSFTLSTSLNRHMHIHTGKKPHCCPSCSKTFTLANRLTIHMQSHTGDKPYVCSLCSKAFSRSTFLDCHMRMHTGEKPYQCALCTKSFSQASALNIHMRSHTGEKPYQCTLCSKSFSRSNYLKSHLRTHTGEKPYQCTVCQKCFAQSNDLRAHVRTHSGEKPFQCLLCPKAFAQSSGLKRHAQIHTGPKDH